jgi:penicillin-binding protein 2
MKKIFNQKKDTRNGYEIEDSILTITEQEAMKIESPMSKVRSNFLWLLILAAFILLGGKVFYLSVMKSGYYQEISRNNRIRSIEIKAPRGKIYDKKGELLVGNIPSLDAVVFPIGLPTDSNEKKKNVEKLASILHLNEGEILGKLESSDSFSNKPILIKENISQEEYLVILGEKNNLSGVEIEKTAIRNYLDGQIFSHILGYEGKIKKEELEKFPDYSLTDYVGKQGVEKKYENDLRGQAGSVNVEVDASSQFKKEVGVINPVPGSDLILSIDAGLQRKITDSLTNILEQSKTETAAAVAINPQNGEILALVSLPSFNNNLFAEGISNEDYQNLITNNSKPLFNRAVSGEYPPGSTIKPLIAAAALTEGTIDEHTTVNCTGGINIGDYHFGDWKTHGVVNVRSAIAESCDVFFYSVGGGYGNISGLGMDRMKKYEDKFGLGLLTGIDISGESTGLVPSPEWKMETLGEKWYTGNDYHASIGQGFLTVTPLQLANYISAIANGGTLYQPKITSTIIDSKGKSKSISPVVKEKNLMSRDVSNIVREGMRETIISGTARSLATLPVPVAGKTGTAQFGSEEKTHAWFVSFAPYENPEIAMVILVEGGGEGHSSAVPVTKEVYEWYFSEARKAPENQ